MTRSTLSRLSDDQLIRDLDHLVSTERTRLVEVLHHLNEIDERKLHLVRGFRSLFCYCTEHLKYSESAAGRRIAVARALRHTPEIGPMLTSGHANLTTIALVAGLLNPDTKKTLLARIHGKSRSGVERIVAEYRPRKVVRDRVRDVCVVTPIVPATMPGLLPVDGVRTHGGTASPGNDDTADDSKSQRATDEKPKPRGETVSAHLVRKHVITFAAGDDFITKLDRARVLLSNNGSVATFEQVFDAAIEVFLEARCPIRRNRRREKSRLRSCGVDVRNDEVTCGSSTGGSRSDGSTGVNSERPKLGVVDTPATAPISLPPAGVNRPKRKSGRHIPAAVRDAVHARDQGRCTFVGAEGKRCRARRFLELDHVEPFALGGTHSMSNLRLLCGAHNRLVAERVFGRDTMDKCARRAP